MNRKELSKTIQYINELLQNGDILNIKGNCIKGDFVTVKGLYMTDEGDQLEVMYIDNQGIKGTIIINLDLRA